MIWSIVAVLVILWLLGFVAHWPFVVVGGWVHILLILAIGVVIYGMIQGRREK